MKKSILVVLVLILAVSCGERDRYIQVSGHAQGGVYAVKANLKGVRVAPEVVRDSVEAILQRIDTTLSGYNKGSLLSRFNAGKTIRPNGLFLEMYRDAYQWFEASEGVLDFAAGPLYDAWGFGFKSGEMPTDAEVAAIRESCGMRLLRKEMTPRPDGSLSFRDVRLDGLDKPMVLNYNAIAQGYSCDLVAKYLYSIGVKDMLVDIGEIFCEGVNPAGRGWTIGVDNPVDSNAIPGSDIRSIWESDGSACGIVTSGNYRKFYIRDGRKYAHTIDPRTGYPVTHDLLSATIVAPTAAEADALATACMVVGPEQARRLIESRPGIEGYLIMGSGTWMSEGFRARTR